DEDVADQHVVVGVGALLGSHLQLNAASLGDFHLHLDELALLHVQVLLHGSQNVVALEQLDGGVALPGGLVPDVLVAHEHLIGAGLQVIELVGQGLATAGVGVFALGVGHVADGGVGVGAVVVVCLKLGRGVGAAPAALFGVEQI